MPADTGSPLAALAEAIALQQAGRLDAAEAVYARLLARDGRDAVVLINAGVLALARGDHAAAVRRLEQAVAIVPANAVAHAHLAAALRAAGRGDAAARSYERVLALRPGDAAATAALATLRARS
jgi:Flp pilus assembly protein TadD